MSGPYCESCKNFVRAAIGSERDYGECADGAKIIYDRNGNRVNEPPSVHEKYTCSRHTPKVDGS
jgi:hypothetical protein